MGKKRLRKNRKKTVKETPVVVVKEQTHKKAKVKQDNVFLEFYDKKYKALLIIPFLILILAISQIAFQTVTTGEFVNRGVSLKGGTTITIPTDKQLNQDEMISNAKLALPKNDVEIRVLKTAGVQTSVIVESDATGKVDTENLLSSLEKSTGFNQSEFSVDVIGSSLGSSFFKEIIIALIVAFVFMGIVVFLYFRTTVPSLAVILAAFSDMTVTVAIVNIMGIKLSTASVAAFLMLIGYSIDTDILLSTRLLKHKGGTVFERVIQSAKTGITMNITTVVAITVVLILSKSEVLIQIMSILFIGLLADLINTWIQNVGILRIYLERKKNEI